MDSNPKAKDDAIMHTDFVDFDGLCDCVEDNLGWMAPARSTMRAWAKSASREKNPVLRDHLPRPHRMTGQRKNLYRRADCEAFAKALLHEAESRLRPPARRRVA